MVWDDDDFLLIPNFCTFTELFLEDADGARTAHVVRHQNIDVHPDVLAGPYLFSSGVGGQNFFSDCHAHRLVFSATW